MINEYSPTTKTKLGEDNVGLASSLVGPWGPHILHSSPSIIHSSQLYNNALVKLINLTLNFHVFNSNVLMI